jgi:hypothetical protein
VTENLKKNKQWGGGRGSPLFLPLVFWKNIDSWRKWQNFAIAIKLLGMSKLERHVDGNF